MLRILMFVSILCACSKSSSSSSSKDEPATGKGSAPAGGAAAPAGSAAATAGPAADVPTRPACPESLTIDCDRLVPKQVRDTFLAGKSMALDNGRCIVGPPGFEVTVSVAKADRALVDKLSASADKVPRLGRLAASDVGDKITFLASALDCAITVHVPNKLAAGTDFGRAIDDHFTADTVSTSPAP